MSASPIRMFCLECGFKSRACARLTKDGRCPSPKVYTIDDTSRRAVARLWRREREKKDEKRDGREERRRRDDATTGCRDTSVVKDGCFEDDWLD